MLATVLSAGVHFVLSGRGLEEDPLEEDRNQAASKFLDIILVLVISCYFILLI